MNMWLQIIVNDVSQLLPVTDVDRKGKKGGRRGGEERRERKGVWVYFQKEQNKKKPNCE